MIVAASKDCLVFSLDDDEICFFVLTYVVYVHQKVQILKAS